jgi:DMSO/TMAO reductase YedYZ molybdopterin-dependent catalytic subunit
VDWDRRRVLAATGALAAAGILSLAVGRWLIIRRAEATRFATALPDPVIRVLPPEPDQSLEIADLTPIIVEDGDFYRIDTALLVPIVDPVGWRLKVTGLVETELALELDDLFELPQHERYVTIACVSNGVGGDLVGNARWQGVRLTEILSMAGVRREATQIVGRSVDGWTSGFPTEAAFDGRDPLVVFGMNGEVLPRRHGYPARLIVPGLYGYVSATKWLEEIEMTTWEDFDAYWIPRGWAKEGPIKTQSRIDRPRSGSLVEPGPLVAAGVAWAPTRGITAVEIQIDDGPWLGADVTRPLSRDAWVQWSVEVEVEAGEHDLRVRATDGTGQTQTGENRGPRPSGATGWHRVSFAAR